MTFSSQFSSTSGEDRVRGGREGRGGCCAAPRRDETWIPHPYRPLSSCRKVEEPPRGWGTRREEREGSPRREWAKRAPRGSSEVGADWEFAMSAPVPASSWGWQSTESSPSIATVAAHRECRPAHPRSAVRFFRWTLQAAWENSTERGQRVLGC